MAGGGGKGEGGEKGEGRVGCKGEGEKRGDARVRGLTIPQSSNVISARIPSPLLIALLYSCPLSTSLSFFLSLSLFPSASLFPCRPTRPFVFSRLLSFLSSPSAVPVSSTTPSLFPCRCSSSSNSSVHFARRERKHLRPLPLAIIAFADFPWRA